MRCVVMLFCFAARAKRVPLAQFGNTVSGSTPSRAAGRRNLARQLQRRREVHPGAALAHGGLRDPERARVQHQPQHLTAASPQGVVRALRSCATIHRMLRCSICFTNWSMKAPNAGGADPHPPAVSLGEKVRAVGEARERRRIVQDAKPGLLHRRAKRARDLRRRTRSQKHPCGRAFSEKCEPYHAYLFTMDGSQNDSAQETKQVTGVATCHRFVSYTSCSLAFQFASTLSSAPYAEYSRVLLAPGHRVPPN